MELWNCSGKLRHVLHTASNLNVYIAQKAIMVLVAIHLIQEKLTEI